eukprot:gene25789-biopygen24017
MPAPPKRKKPIARATRHARATPTPVSWDPRGGDQHTFWCQGALRKNVSSAPHPIASKRDPGRALSRAEGTPHDVEPYGLHADGDGERSVQPCEGAGLARQRALSAVFLAAPPTTTTCFRDSFEARGKFRGIDERRWNERSPGQGAS